MKFLIFILLVMAFCWSADTRSVCLDGVGQNGPNLVDIQFNSAKLNQVENAFVQVYGLNCKYCPTLPVTKDQLIGVINVNYRTSADRNTQSPTWGTVFSFPRTAFNEESTIAIELWNQDSISSETYLGGAFVSIADLQNFDKQFQLKVVDRKGNSVGQLDITWFSGQC